MSAKVRDGLYVGRLGAIDGLLSGELLGDERVEGRQLGRRVGLLLGLIVVTTPERRGQNEEE